MAAHLVVGAGASLAESKCADLLDEKCLPLISNLAGGCAQPEKHRDLNDEQPLFELHPVRLTAA
jgi:hypothetical protein